MTQALAVATEAATATEGKPPATLAPTISVARTVTTAAYLITKDTAGGAKALIWLGLLALGVGIASMFVSIPIVGTVGLAVLLTGAILLGIGLWRRSLYAAGFVVAIAIALIAAAPWLPYLHRHLFSWLEKTAGPYMDHHSFLSRAGQSVCRRARAWTRTKWHCVWGPWHGRSSGSVRWLVMIFGEFAGTATCLHLISI